MKMKKWISRVMAFALAMMMVLGMNMSALAASNLNISGTKANGKVEAFKLFNRTESTVNEKKVVAYTLNDRYAGYFTQTGKVGDGKTGDALSAAAYEYVSGLSSAEKATDLSQFAADMWKWLASQSGMTADATVDATAGTTTLSLDAGYYLVFPAGASVLKDAAKSPAMLLDVDGTSTVNADLKSEYPTVKKTVKTTADGTDGAAGTVKPGDTITYTITSKVPDVSGYNKGYVFKINDTLSAGLTFKELTSVKIDDSDLGETNYTLTKTAEENAQKLTLELKNMATGTDGSMTPNIEVYPVGATITVTYTATVNEKAVTGINPNTNKASVTYSNDPSTNGTGTSEEVHADVYTFAFDIYKYTLTNDQQADAEGNRTALAGAQFKLYAANGDAKGDEISLVDETKGVYRQAKDDKEDKVEYITTGDTGIVTIKGLKDGTYYLTETKAPDGFNKLVGDIKVEINNLTYAADDATKLERFDVVYTMPGETSTTVTVTTDGKAQIPVRNNAGTVLPSTGGNGGIVFTIVGVAIIGVMMVSSLVSKKRKNAK
ncbi:SpaH/EbpB family LPXTG-anchored major pilin [Clostridium sp. AM33-3]|uniref:SpaH/EbpB family LPXTG-anchored major pilin n=1 Tax=Clostridium sp. AM33-3 TaxID=2292304 RepID=UPI000E517965|nr:SpaH/EbpB family LPXTG-anchored major pilin [Clostridium sp. AM33-3]RHT19065.1 isopeptide-forming domain-containing fimbrial protein [Clostridium sp. AM33-3]